MKFVADENIDRQIVDRLRSDGHEVHYVATLDTEALKPGPYKLIVSLPNGTDAIFREFTLVP